MIVKKYTLLTSPPSVREESEAMDFLLQRMSEKIIKIHISVSSMGQGDTLPNLYDRWCTFLYSRLKGQVPAFTIVHQAPCNGAYLSAEIIEIEAEPDVQLMYASHANAPYVLLKKNTYRELWTGGFYGFDSQTDKAANIAFEKLKSFLEINDFTFDNLIRQWNYIGNILEEKKVGGKHLQNYQVFNEVRNTYYTNNKQELNYPAATGIGMIGEGIVIDAIAVKTCERNIPIQSPIQQDAYVYEQKFLKGESLNTKPKKTPLFDRARLLFDTENAELYVSGTASIKGQETIDADNVFKQTDNTIQCIEELCDIKNIKQKCVDFKAEKRIYKRVRVYVKPLQYTPALEEKIRSQYRNASLNIVSADICRDDLLIEIEADLNYLP